MGYMERAIWPDNKKSAAIITVNLSAEFFWLDLEPECKNMPKTLSMGQYGMTNGLERVLQALAERNLRATFFVPGRVAEIYSDLIKDILDRGHEIAMGSNRQENLAILSQQEQQKSLKDSFESIKKLCSIGPRGFRSPHGELTLGTMEMLTELGIEYSSNLSDDDRPYYLPLKSNKPLLEIPVHWAMYDLPYFAFNYKPAFPIGQGRIANYSGVLHNWKEEFDGYYDLSLCYVLQVDPQTIGSPGRIPIFEEILDYITAHEDTWVATCGEMNDYYKRG